MERMRQESVVCRKMDEVLAAKQEADRKYETQRMEYDQMRRKLSD